LLKPKKAVVLTNGTPLSVRIARGRPKSLNVRSKTLKA